MIKTLLLALTALLIAVPAYADVRCALIENGSLARLQTFESECPPDPAGKPWYDWMAAPVVAPPAHDPETEVLEGPTYSVGESEVTESWNVRNKTAQEIDAEKDAKLAAMQEATLKALCHLKNEIRTKVDQTTAWSEAQCLAAFKTLLP